jgi:arylsulfatase A-like enzyme
MTSATVPESRFGRTIGESDLGPPPTAPVPPTGPNVVVILLDDVGFCQLGSFGSDVATPNMDRLANGGLRYNQFHVTALCSPTRASLLTGRNHHAVGMGFVPDIPMRLPGYAGKLAPSAATMARHFRDAGYSTMAFGKWHLTPRWDRTASGPFGHWPLGQGFERFYGFLHADTNQWTPNLVSDNHFVDPPKSPEEGYHLTEDLADAAIRQLSDQQHATPDKPFFMYFATGAQHAPHQAPPEWIDRYKGQFDGGWERWREAAFARQQDLAVVPRGTQCTERPPWVQEWDSRPPEEQRLFARTQEVFAGFLSHTDEQIGRLISALETRGLLDDTIIVLLSDNGASAEGSSIGSINEGRFTLGLDRLEDNLAHIDEWGGFRLYNHYAWGWAWAGNTPFHLWKRYAWLGGTRVPLIVHWPSGISARGQVRTQFCHVIDLMPTLLDACGVSAAPTVDGVAQQPVDGASLRTTFDEPDAPAPRQQQYFEMLGSRSMYLDGWKATTNRVTAGVADEKRLIPGSESIDDDTWALFNLEEDFAEANDLSAAHPELVRQLEQLWWAEAGRNQVLPMGNWMARALPDAVMAMSPPPRAPMGRKVFYPGAGPIADEAVPMLRFGGRIEVDVDVPENGGEGVLCAQGNWTGGWALVVVGGQLTFVVNSLSTPLAVRADSTLSPGRKMLAVEYRLGTQGTADVSLWVNEKRVGARALPAGTELGGQADGNALRLGYDGGFPVSDEYTPPFPWTGALHHVVVEGGPLTPTRLGSEIADIVHRD